MNKEKVKDIDKEILEFYSKKDFLNDMKDEMETLIDNILYENGINFHEVIGRVKSEYSIREKLKRRKLSLNDLKDIIGIRVIAFLNSEVERINKIIEKEFKINWEITKDHRNKIKGYRGRNYVVKLHDKRSELIENNRFKDFEFEIQVTTILDHAWSEIQHDRNYKLKGRLPERFRKQFKLLASTLELLDLQFDDLCSQVDEKIKEIGKRTQEGDIEDIEIDSISLKGYLNEFFKEYLGNKIIPIFGYRDSESGRIISDLNLMGIRKLGELKKIIPFWIKEYLDAQPVANTDYYNFIIDLLVINFGESYFSKSKFVKENMSIVLTNEEANLFDKYEVGYLELCKKYGVKFEVIN